MTPSPIAPDARGKKLFCFGYGYTASFLAERLRAFDWKIAGTTTDPEKRAFMRSNGVEAHLFDPGRALGDPQAVFAGVTHALVSIPPGAKGDIAADMHGADLARLPDLEWLGYLSTTGVYGNRDGNWVDETAQPAPTSRRGSLRLLAEREWQELFLRDGLPLHIFRLAGIYGPGRSALDAVRAGTAKRIGKPGHVFNRIHVEDAVQALIASMNAPNPGAIYNLADDLPSPSCDVIAFACGLLGMEVPPLSPFDGTELAPIVRSFYKDNKRVRNARLREELGVTLLHPDYRAGLQACFAPEARAMDFLRPGGGAG